MCSGDIFLNLMAPIKTDSISLHAVFKVDVDQPLACIRQIATDGTETLLQFYLSYNTAYITEDSMHALGALLKPATSVSSAAGSSAAWFGGCD